MLMKELSLFFYRHTVKTFTLQADKSFKKGESLFFLWEVFPLYQLHLQFVCRQVHLNVVELYGRLFHFSPVPQNISQSSSKKNVSGMLFVLLALCVVCHCAQAGASVWVQHTSSTAGGCLWSSVPCPVFVLLWRSPSCPKVPDSTSR